MAMDTVRRGGVMGCYRLVSAVFNLVCRQGARTAAVVEVAR